jgi:hypothetical protein
MGSELLRETLRIGEELARTRRQGTRCDNLVFPTWKDKWAKYNDSMQ